MLDSAEQSESRPADWARFRSYLLLLARVHLAKDLRGRLSASDLVQETLLEAHRNPGVFETASRERQIAWLRRALVTNAAKAGRDHRRLRRDVRRERSLDAAMERSSLRIGGLIAADAPSPSEHAIRAERVLRTTDALAQLTDAQQDVILLHHLEGLSMREIAARLGKSETATVALLHRGLRRLRELTSE